jgi:hypothetical protein
MGVLYPNYDYNTRYWQCTELNQPLAARTCVNENEWFSFYHQGCVPIEQWVEPPPKVAGK